MRINSRARRILAYLARLLDHGFEGQYSRTNSITAADDCRFALVRSLLHLPANLPTDAAVGRGRARDGAPPVERKSIAATCWDAPSPGIDGLSSLHTTAARHGDDVRRRQ